ncbi:phospho-N-acetylmuramoyl-pentapeptide-transferase [Patescibacteria group bacterium]|nr:phospho-N-acetylmuramoyl-pentapeptide-transferase [Patescibacteria group bacterium]
MIILFGALLFSWFMASILFIPFIRLLYHLKFQRLRQKTLDAFNNRTPIFDRLHKNKAGTPVGGGLLIIAITTALLPVILLLLHYFWYPVTHVYPMRAEVKILLFTFVSFGLLGLVDDIKKTFVLPHETFFGLRLRHKLVLEILLASIIGFWMVRDLQIDIIYVPVLGVIQLGWWYIFPAVLFILGFANAFNITDGLDGLASGVLMIALFSFWIISASILDTPLSVFLAVWIGAILAFLYFNVHPARIFLGDVGALSFGATLATVGLILGKGPVLLLIGGVFVVEVLSSFLQLVSKRFFGKKLFSVAPLHLWLQYNGWPETKIVMRFWVISIILSIFGLWLALLTKSPLS